MKFYPISVIQVLFIALILALISGNCTNSGNKKTESKNQEITVKDSAVDAVPETIDDNIAVHQEATPAAAKESGTAKKESKPSSSSKSASKPENPKKTETPQTAKTEPGKVQTTVEQPKTDPVSPPAKAVVEKEETKAPAQQDTPSKPEPVAEKPKEVVVAQQPVKENVKTAGPAPGNWIVPAKDKNKTNPVQANTESLKTGKSLYVKHCASCHGKSGRGDGSKAAQLKTPSGDFTLPAFHSQSDGSIFYKIKEGRDDMPVFKKKLPVDEDIWHIVNYIRTFK